MCYCTFHFSFYLFFSVIEDGSCHFMCTLLGGHITLCSDKNVLGHWKLCSGKWKCTSPPPLVIGRVIAVVDAKTPSIKWPVPWLIVKNTKIQLLLLYLCFSPHFEVIGFVILFKCRLRAVSLFSWSVEENARDTQMTTRVTEGARRAAGCRPRHSARRSRARALPRLNLKKKRDCSHSSLSKSIPTLTESLGRSVPPRPSKVDPV